MLGCKDQNNRCSKNFKGKLYRLLKLCDLEPSQSRSISSCAKSLNNRRAPSKEEGLSLKCNLWGTVRHWESLKIAVHKLHSLSIFTELPLKFLRERYVLLTWFGNQYLMVNFLTFFYPKKKITIILSLALRITRFRQFINWYIFKNY